MAGLLEGLEPLAGGARPDAGAPAGSEGHRARLRLRLLTAGPEALADHEMLEMVLFLALPRRDTKPLARTLLTRFGSFTGAIAAPPIELATIDGLGDAGVAALKLVQVAAVRLARSEVINRPVLTNWDRLMGYLTASLARERVEQFRVLFLDTRNRLLADEAQGRGTVNHTPVYPREVVKRALELHATALILVHNHPSGDPTPSAADIDMTREIRAAAEALSIALHDHVIIGNDQWLSFRREGLLWRPDYAARSYRRPRRPARSCAVTPTARSPAQPKRSSAGVPGCAPARPPRSPSTPRRLSGPRPAPTGCRRTRRPRPARCPSSSRRRPARSAASLCQGLWRGAAPRYPCLRAAAQLAVHLPAHPQQQQSAGQQQPEDVQQA